jgi:hypothetical protein
MTPNSATTSLSDAADFGLRYDVRSLGDLISDIGRRVGVTDSNQVVVKLLLAARGKMEAALARGKRYLPAVLDTLTGASLEHAKNIECGLAFLTILERRPTLLQSLPITAQQAIADLQALSEGVNVLGFDEAYQAGMKLEKVSNPPTLLTDKASRYFGPLS